MPDEHNDTTTAADEAQPVKRPIKPMPPLKPSGVEHLTMTGGLFGGFDVVRSEYIKPRPRRSWLSRLIRGG
jgi:hypothetical protein